MLRPAIILLVVLIAFWAMLSGIFNYTFVLVAGGLSIVFIVFMMFRMGILDEEMAPYSHGQSLSYFSWLFGEIIASNMAVVKAVLNPDLEISPKMVSIPMHHDTDLGKVTFANSITLTPGTVSVAMGEDEILVHALLADMARPKSFLEMEAKSAWAVGDNGVVRAKE